MARWLITGGAGFIGSHIAEILLAQKERVRILDNFYSGNLENLAHLKGKYELIRGDVRDEKSASIAVRGIDFVLHQAAMRSVPRSIQQPRDCNSMNVEGTLNMLLASQKAGVKKFVLASSSSVYGDSKLYPQKESHLARPISPYAASKISGEHYCHVFSKTYGLPCISLRYFNVFGPRQDPLSKYAAVIPKFIVEALAGKPLEIHWDGRQSRDFAYVTNVARANILAAKIKNLRMGVYNVACGATTSLLDIARLLEKFTHKKLKRRFSPKRGGDVRKTWADITNLKRDFEMEKLVGFEEGLKHTFDFFAEGERWRKYL